MKNKLNITSALLFSLLSVLQSCNKDRLIISGKGNNVTNTRNLSGFSGIDISINAKVYFVKDSNYRLEIIGQQNILDVIKTESKDNHIKIFVPWHTILRKHNPIEIYVYGPQLNFARVNGSSSIFIKQTSNNSNTELLVNGSGNIHITDIITNTINYDISGSGEITIESGSTESQDIQISGSGNVDCAGVINKKATVKISGSGCSKVYASEILDGNISGSGDIYYKGNPKITQKISGSGKIKPL